MDIFTKDSLDLGHHCPRTTCKEPAMLHCYSLAKHTFKATVRPLYPRKKYDNRTRCRPQVAVTNSGAVTL